MSKFSKRRLVENEVIFRDVNKNIQEFVDKENSIHKTVLPFYCECANPDCIDRIELKTEDYAKFHKHNNQFVVLPGHNFPEVEKVVKKTSKYYIVEKYFTPPKPESIDLALKAINT